MVTGIIRAARGPNGTRAAVLTRFFGRIARSSAVIAGCSAGSSRKYQNQAIAQRKLAVPTTTNEPRQPTQGIRRMPISGGVSVLPSLANACVMPCAKPRFSGRVQFDMARVATGSADTRSEEHTSELQSPDVTSHGAFFFK